MPIESPGYAGTPSADELESALIADANRSRCPFSHSIDGKNGRSFKGRGMKSTGSVRTVMDFLQDGAIVAQVTPNQLGRWILERTHDGMMRCQASLPVAPTASSVCIKRSKVSDALS